MRRRNFLGMASMFPFTNLTKVLPETIPFVTNKQIGMLASKEKSKILALFPNGFYANTENIGKILDLGVNHLEMINLKIPLNGCFVDKDNSQYWYKDGLIHRDNNLPAVIWANGTQLWYKEGKQHRDNDQPAVIRDDGLQYWCKNGQLRRDNDRPTAVFANGDQCWFKEGRIHRDNDLPAVVNTDGTKQWCQKGLAHRDNDQPAIILANGDQKWYQHGNLHRDNDLPAIIEANGNQKWYQKGNLHRDNDQPAIVRGDGTKEWWKNGEKYNAQNCENQNVDNAQLETQNTNNDNQPIAFLSKEQIKMLDFYEGTSVLNGFPEGVYLNQENVNKLIELGLSLCRLISLRIAINGVFITNGETHHLLNGLHHSFNDQPAIILANGDQYWYQEGKLHRDNDLPAIVKYDGTKYWYKYGKIYNVL